MLYGHWCCSHMDNNVIMSISKVVNINSAKTAAFPIALILVIVHAIHYIDSGDSCSRLYSSGTLVDDKTWHADGCMMHTYKQGEAEKCLERQKIVFIGDSRLRELFYELVDKVSSSPFARIEKAHSDIAFKQNGIQIDFKWRPEVNQSVTDFYTSLAKNIQSQPDFIIQSAATHTIKRTNGSISGLDEFRANLTKLTPLLEQTAKTRTKIFWTLQEPVLEEKLYTTRRSITNSLINQYNDAAVSILETDNGVNVFHNVFVMKSLMQAAQQSIQSSSDGLHLGTGTKEIDVHVLLNLFCNDVIKPSDGSCCQKPPPITLVQILAFAFGCLCIVSSVVAHCFYKKSPNEKNNNVEAAEKNSKTENASLSMYKEIISACARMSLILFYFYICDRTDIFMKASKYYTHIRFFIPLLYVAFLGMFAIDKTKSTSLLNRDQTDEWKGWMQLIILIYHITGASANIPIYMHIRLLVSMYLFMTGYGHFSYFWNKGDFSFYRLFGVLFRLNFLTVMLCIVMNRSYQFYYFVPMCTFWFLVLYASMALWPRAYVTPSRPTVQHNQPEGVAELKEVLQNGPSTRSPTVIMCLKLLALTALIIFLFLSKKTFESLFSWWPIVRLFELPTGSVREWWFRCQLDRFAMVHGAVFCFMYIILKRMSFLDDSKQGCLMPTKASLITVTVSIVTIMIYTFWAMHCTSKQVCNSVHSYASILPITSFILIRNIPGYLRSVYSSFFAWFGKISLELFIGQYHIWLAADTKGILVLTSPSWPSLNLVVTTFLFVCVAHEINRLTGIFAKYCVGSAKDGTKSTVIKFSVIAGILLCLGIVNDLTRAVTIV